MLAVVAGLYLTSKSPQRKYVLAPLAVLVFIPLLYTLSRASYLALIPLVGGLLAFSQRKLLIAFALALSLVLAPFLLPKAVVNRVLYTFTQPFHPGQTQIGGVRLDTSTSARLKAFQDIVFDDWPKHPTFGYGVTGYKFLDSQYLRVLVETGLVGLLAFLWLQISLFRRTRDILTRTQDPLFKGVALGFLAGFIALIVHSIGANTFIIVRIIEPFWFLAAMVMMIPQLEASPATSETATGPAPTRRTSSGEAAVRAH
jgi:O-antigen ligase